MIFAGHPVATVRPDAFKRCLANLMNNAARHGNRIAIAGHRDERYLQSHVDDDGPGIPPDAREKVFRPFVRLDEARNQDEGGTGLGLAIARDIARSHGGEICSATARSGACARRAGAGVISSLASCTTNSSWPGIALRRTASLLPGHDESI